MSPPNDLPAATPTALPAVLGADEVHIWLALPSDLEQDDCRQASLGLLSDDELARYQRYRHLPSRDQFLAARSLMRRVLSRYAGVPPASWTFSTNEYGRPEIDTPAVSPRLRFNVSHTTGLVACAVVYERDIGVDIETVNRRNGGVHLAERYFSPAEVRDLCALPESQQHRTFFDYWTLKESYIKARGKGLAIPLDAFSFALVGGAMPQISFDARLVDQPQAWQFMQAWPTAEHRLALAVRRAESAPLNVRMIFSTLSRV